MAVEIGIRLNAKLEHLPLNRKDPANVLKTFKLKVHLSFSLFLFIHVVIFNYIERTINNHCVVSLGSIPTRDSIAHFVIINYNEMNCIIIRKKKKSNFKYKKSIIYSVSTLESNHIVAVYLEVIVNLV